MLNFQQAVFSNSCFQYTKQRQVFGKAVIENQYVHYRLAELQTEVELLRALTYRLTAQVKMHHKHHLDTLEIYVAFISSPLYRINPHDECLNPFLNYFRFKLIY